jgi:hypothetical protein
MLKILTAVFALVLVGVEAGAATLRVDTSGKLARATGVSYVGALYNVQFLDGSCAEIFAGCDAPDDFAFTTEDDAVGFAGALFEQVLLDTPLGLFDSRPDLTRGCGDPRCFVDIPFAADAGFYLAASASNNPTDDADEVLPVRIPSNLSVAPLPFVTFARVTPVPLPAGIPLVLTGLGALCLLRRRCR